MENDLKLYTDEHLEIMSQRCMANVDALCAAADMIDGEAQGMSLFKRFFFGSDMRRMSSNIRKAAQRFQVELPNAIEVEMVSRGIAVEFPDMSFEDAN